MRTLETECDFYGFLLTDRFHARTEPLADDAGLQAYFPCGKDCDNALGCPMEIEGELETTISFFPYDAAERNVVSIWTACLAVIPTDCRREALRICNDAVLTLRPRFTKPFVDDDGGLYFGAQGFVDEGLSTFRLITSFLEELDKFWPVVRQLREL